MCRGHWAAVRPNGSRIVIHLCGKWEERGDDKPGVNTDISFYSDDKKKTYEEPKAKGVKFAKGLTTEWFGTYTIFRDPDGNEFCM